MVAMLTVHSKFELENGYCMHYNWCVAKGNAELLWTIKCEKTGIHGKVSVAWHSTAS